MNNIHNFRKFSPPLSIADHGRLWFILSIAIVLIGGELLWAKIRMTDFEIDNYSATIFSTMPNRDIIEARQLDNEAEAVEAGSNLEEEWLPIDAEVNTL